MRIGFYPKLAFDGIRKNKRMYLPYILTCVGMVMMYYIIAFLAHNDTLELMPGGRTMSELIGFGTGIIAAFSCIFLFYTNSFLIRRRKKEFGLYNILGMGKRNIALILFWETLIISAISLTAGLGGGIALSKLAELGFVNILKGEVNYDLSVSPTAVVMTLKVFGVIFLLLFLNALRQVRFSTAISLMHSESTGEKPPKANWFFGILGVAVLGTAYYVAVTIKNPLQAFAVFFAAVIMVIIGTYLIMISGSVLLCRILQKKKNYYYNKKHFVSVSSMAYRMKRNGAGLASICILATMVLVMVSSTTALYFGSEDSLNQRYPRDINMEFRYVNAADMTEENISGLRDEILGVADGRGIKPENVYDYRSASISGAIIGDVVETDVSAMETLNINTYSELFWFDIIPLEDYNALMGKNETLAEDEAMIHVNRGEYSHNTITFNRGESFKVKKQLDEMIGNGTAAMSIVPTMTIVVANFDSVIKDMAKLVDFNSDQMLQLVWNYKFDTNADRQVQLGLFEKLTDSISAEAKDYGCQHSYYESREAERADYYALYGGLFYLGIILSIVFIFAAVLIIYYKQISEGYEDQSRFDIMQKVGMTKKEIRKSINSQLLTVFFLPLVGAGCHLAFAFPIIKKMLLLFNLSNVTLFVATTAVSFLAFAMFYAVVYRVTSNAYYNIVSGAKKDD